MSLKLEKKMRDEMVQVLQSQIVPAQAGHVLIQIANILASLKEEDAPTGAQQVPKVEKKK